MAAGGRLARGLKNPNTTSMVLEYQVLYATIATMVATNVRTRVPGQVMAVLQLVDVIKLRQATAFRLEMSQYE